MSTIDRMTNAFMPYQAKQLEIKINVSISGFKDCASGMVKFLILGFSATSAFAETEEVKCPPEWGYNVKTVNEITRDLGSDFPIVFFNRGAGSFMRTVILACAVVVGVAACAPTQQKANQLSEFDLSRFSTEPSPPGAIMPKGLSAVKRGMTPTEVQRILGQRYSGFPAAGATPLFLQLMFSHIQRME